MTERLAENHVAVFRQALLEFFLQVTTPMLVLAKLRDLPGKVLQTRSRESIDYRSLINTTPASQLRCTAVLSGTYTHGQCHRACAWARAGRSSSHPGPRSDVRSC